MSPLFALLNVGTIAGLALLVWIFWAPAWQRRRAEAPLRTELRARPAVDFSTKVTSKALLFGSDLPMREMQDWIVVQGLPATRHNRVWITKRGQLAPIWDALIRPGAQPASPPPR